MIQGVLIRVLNALGPPTILELSSQQAKPFLDRMRFVRCGRGVERRGVKFALPRQRAVLLFLPAHHLSVSETKRVNSCQKD